MQTVCVCALACHSLLIARAAIEANRERRRLTFASSELEVFISWTRVAILIRDVVRNENQRAE